MKTIQKQMNRYGNSGNRSERERGRESRVRKMRTSQFKRKMIWTERTACLHSERAKKAKLSKLIHINTYTNKTCMLTMRVLGTG